MPRGGGSRTVRLGAVWAEGGWREDACVCVSEGKECELTGVR